MNCEFASHGDYVQCVRCGRVVRVTGSNVVAVCRSLSGLGDMVANGLAAVGITKDRVQAVASAFGIEDCGCQQRQAALNKLGEQLGLPPGSTANG